MDFDFSSLNDYDERHSPAYRTPGRTQCCKIEQVFDFATAKKEQVSQQGPEAPADSPVSGGTHLG